MNSMFVPAPALEEAIGNLASSKTLLLGLDFDGTLAPIVPVPNQARMPDQTREILTKLGSDPRITLALISGRDIQSLTNVANPDPTWVLIGSHGSEVKFPGEESALLATPSTHLTELIRDVLQEAGFQVLDITVNESSEVLEQTGHKELLLEIKPAGVGVHYRNLDDVSARKHVTGLLKKFAQDHQEFTFREGLMVSEFSTSSLTKADGMRLLQRRSPEDSAALYIGDDTTDEDIFQYFQEQRLRESDRSGNTVGGTQIGIRVGLKDSTAADFRVPDTHAVLGVLASLMQRRTA